MPFPSFTKTYHHKPYATISPTRPELSAEGKVVLITGAGSGVGAATALAFAQAHAKVVVLTGRRTSALERTKSSIEAENLKSEIAVHSLDVSSEEGVRDVFAAVAERYGTINVCVHCAGHLSDAGSLKDTSVSNFWTSFEVNVKGSFLITHAFLNQKHATCDRMLILVNSLLAHFAAKDCKTAPASYAICKMGQAKLAEYVASENDNDPHLRVYTVHPGVIQSEMSDKSLAMSPPGTKESMTWDSVHLPAHYFVWLSSPESKFIPNGRYLWTHWDVNEMQEHSAGLQNDPMLLTMTLKGWPGPYMSKD